jgi:hypothetical protein
MEWMNEQSCFLAQTKDFFFSKVPLLTLGLAKPAALWMPWMNFLQVNGQAM